MPTYLVKYKSTTDWKKKARLLYLYHTLRKTKVKTWTVRDTAKYFQISIGAVSENIKIGENFNRIRDCKSRNQAIKRLRGFKV